MKMDISKLKTDFKFSKNNVQNKIGMKFAVAMAKKLKMGSKDVKFDRKMVDHKHSDAKVEVINLLKNTSLPKG